MKHLEIERFNRPSVEIMNEKTLNPLFPRFTARQRKPHSKRKLKGCESYVVAQKTEEGLVMSEPRLVMDNCISFSKSECTKDRLKENEVWVIYDHKNKEFKEEIV